jgi:hypothetical protein
MTKLMGLRFKIIYRKGREILAVDALSRIHSLMQIQALSKVRHVWLQEVINSYATDYAAQELLAQLAIASPNDQGYTLQQGIIRHGSQIWIADIFALKTKLIAACHSSVIGDHSGLQATYHKIKKLFIWKRDQRGCGELCQAVQHLSTC